MGYATPRRYMLALPSLRLSSRFCEMTYPLGGFFSAAFFDELKNLAS